MNLLSLIKYPLESLARNKRRSLFAIVGIVLALSLIAGSSIAVDSSAYGLLRAAIKGIEVDMVADQPLSDFVVRDQSYFDARTEALENIKYVEQSEPIVTVDGWSLLSDSTYTDFYQYPVVFLDQDDTKTLEAHKINGELPDAGTIAISAYVADTMSVGVGDDLTLCMAEYDYYYDPVNYTYVKSNVTWLNLTFEVSKIWTQDPSAHEEVYWGPSTGIEDDMVAIRYSVNPIVMLLSDIDEVIPGLQTLELGSYPQYEFLIWVDRDEVISLSSIQGTIERLQFVEQRVNMAGSVYGFYFSEDLLIRPLWDLGSQLEYMKVVFIVLSLPVVALGTYLSVVGVDLGLNERRREIGILKSRGGSNRQVFSFLFLESLFLGVITGLMGLGLGILVSRFLLGVAVGFRSDLTSSPELSDLSINSNTVLLAIGFGVLLMFVSSYRPLRRISKTDVAEALHHYSPSITQIGYKVRTDVILLGLSVLSILSTWMGTEWLSRQGGSFIVQMVLSLLILVGIAMFPLMPFFLSLSIVRLVTRGSRRLYSKLTVIVKPWTKELHYLVDKNVIRNPRRASNLGVIISLALAFGLFISITMESTIAYEHERVKFDVGCDIKLTATIYTGDWSMDIEEVVTNLTFLDDISEVEGVESAARFATTQISSASYYYGWWASIALLDPSDYAETVNPSDFYFEGADPDMADIETNGTVLVRSEWADNYGIVVGDLLNAQFDRSYWHNGTWNQAMWVFPLRVVGMVKGLPGLGYQDIFVSWDTLSFISDENLSYGGLQIGSFIDASPGYDVHDVASDASAVYVQTGGITPYTYIMEDEIDMLSSDPFFGPLADFLYMEYALSIAIMSIGVGLIIFVAVSDREVELACIMARGSSGSQMRKILMGESISLMALGLIVGASVGLLTSFLFNELFSVDIGDIVPRRMVFTMTSWVIVGVSVLSLLAASFIATARAGRIRLAEVLRIRGG
ncbi:MAG TPA: FtsX-like permease family protein [Thermoplasmata archaeon]